jgi:hypothetical protein
VPFGFDLKARLTDLGVDDADAEYFARNAKQDGILVVVNAERNQVDLAAKIMRDANGKTRDMDREINRR